MQFFCIRTEAIRITHQALQSLAQTRRGSLRPARVLRVAQLYGYLQWRCRSQRAVRLTLRELGAAWLVQPRLLRGDLEDLQALGWLRFCSDANGTTVEITGAGVEPPAETDTEPEALPGTESRSAGPAAELRAIQPEQTAAPVRSAATAHREEEPTRKQLIARFAELYNAERPRSWPAYNPRGTALAPRLQRAIEQAGGREAFWQALRLALQAMPEFWRTVYPRGRSGADCIAALLSADRKAGGLGVEFWHVFSWAGGAEAGGRAVGGNGDPEYRRACRLLAWGDHCWRAQGMEAIALPDGEKRRLAELLEASGIGTPGQAARQFPTALSQCKATV